MAKDIAHGRVVIDVDLDKVGAELREAEARFAKTMRSIDSMDADAEVGIDSRGFDREIAKIKEQIAKLNLAEADPRVKLDADEAKLDIKVLRAQLAYLNSQKTTLKIDADEAKAARKEVERVADAEAARAKLNKKYEDDAAKRYEDRINNIRRESIMRDRANSMNVRFDANLQKSYMQQARLQSQAIELDRKRAGEVAKLRQEYAKMVRVAAGMKRAALFGEGDRLALSSFNADMDTLRYRIKKAGGEFVDLDRNVEGSGASIGKFVSSVGSMRVQMGPLSGTLRQVATGFSVLGPVLFAVAGQIISLIGVIGTGLAGALSVGAAGLSAFALSTAGIFFIMKPLVGELKDATAASSAYNDAVRKYGKGSSEAQGKLEQLNQTLGNISPQAKEAFKNFSSFGDRWAKLTAGARPAFFETIASGMAAANKMLPMFARESVATFNTAATATQKWTKALSSAGAKSGIQQIMSNFREALPDLNAGMLALGATFGHISVSASKLLPSLMQGFDGWASNIMDSVGTGAALDAKINRLVEHMRELGHFAQATTGMLATFFNAGANQGASLLGTLTSIFNQWNAWMQSTSGQNSLASFFEQANTIGKQFFASLGQMGVALFELSSALAPLSQGFVEVIRFAAQLTAAIMDFSAARAVITGLGAALATAFVLTKAAAFIQILREIPVAIAAIRTAGMAALFTTPAGPLVALAAAAVGVGVAMATLIGPSEALASSLAGIASDAQMAQAALDRLNGVELSASEAASRLTRDKLALAQANDIYQKFEQKGTEKTRAGVNAMLDVLDASNRVKQSRRDLNAAIKDGSKIEQDQTAHAFDRIGTLQDEREMMVRNLGVQKNQLGFMRKGSEAYQEQSDKIRETEQRIKDLDKAIVKTKKNAMKVGERNAMIEELNAGLRTGIAIAPQYADEWARISRSMATGGKIANDAGKAIANIFPSDPAKAGKAIDAYAKALDSGLGKQAKQIVLNPKLNPKQVLDQLRGLQKNVSTNVTAKVNKGKAEKDLGSLGKGKTATINTKANTAGAEKSLRGLSSKRLAAMLTIRANDSDAVGKLNKIQRARLTAKLVSLGADKSAAEAAVKSVNAKKLSNKTAKFDAKADIGAVEAADRRIQNVKDKTVRMRTTADTSGVSSVQSAINSLPSEVVIPVRVSGSASVSRAAGGPVVGAASGRDIGPAAQRRREDSATRANSPANSNGGTYARPTLLVGEENRREYVIATNPAYRQNNVGYLAAAADEFGYRLETAAAGLSHKQIKKSKKHFNKTTAPKKAKAPTAEALGKTRTDYDWVRGEITRYDTAGSNERTRQDQEIDAGRMTAYDKSALLAPYTAEQGLYATLRSTIGEMIKGLRASLGTQMGVDKGISDKELKNFKDRVTDLKKNPVKEKRDKKGNVTNKSEVAKYADRLRLAENNLADAQRRDKAAKSKTPGLKDQIAQLERELTQQIPGEEAALANTISAINDAKANLPSNSGSDETPIGIQIGAFDKARYDFMNQFSSNTIGASGVFAAPGSSGAATAFGFAGGSTGAPAYYGAGGDSAGGPASLLSSSSGSGSVSGMSGSRGGVTQNITIAEAPPNPHIFTQEMAWEAGAAF